MVTMKLFGDKNKTSEWGLELPSEKKQKKYFCSLIILWGQKAQRMLTELDRQPTLIPKKQ